MVFKKNFSTSGGSVEIVDNLTSTATDKALSAAQGKVLNDGKADVNHNHDFDYADIAHVSDTNNPHSVTAAQVGLSNVDNTADVDKPISTATQSALNAKADTSALHNHSNKTLLDTLTDAGDGSKLLADDGTYVTPSSGVDVIDALNSTSPTAALSANQGKVLNDGKADTTHNHDADYASKASEHSHSNKTLLDTLTDAGDGSKMLADDGTYVTPSSGVDVIDALNSTSPTAALSANQGKVLNDGKAAVTHNHDLDYADIAHVSDTNNPHSVTQAQVGLSNVDNTADVDKPVAVRRVQQTGLACDFANHSYIVATISANSSFTITNLPTDQMVTVLINNTSQTDVTVTLPNTADVKPSADYVIGGGGGKYREFSIYFDGVTRFWQVSEELV